MLRGGVGKNAYETLVSYQDRRANFAFFQFTSYAILVVHAVFGISYDF